MTKRNIFKICLVGLVSLSVLKKTFDDDYFTFLCSKGPVVGKTFNVSNKFQIPSGARVNNCNFNVDKGFKGFIVDTRQRAFVNNCVFKFNK